MRLKRMRPIKIPEKRIFGILKSLRHVAPNRRFVALNSLTANGSNQEAREDPVQEARFKARRENLCLKRCGLFLNQYPGFDDDSPYLGICLKPVKGLLVGYKPNLIVLQP